MRWLRHYPRAIACQSPSEGHKISDLGYISVDQPYKSKREGKMKKRLKNTAGKHKNK
jgi:hypothetical protein